MGSINRYLLIYILTLFESLEVKLFIVKSFNKEKEVLCFLMTSC